MGIIKRFKDIMSSNINAALDKAEDPEKMIDQYLRDLESDLGKVKAETASVIAAEKRAERTLKENEFEINKMQSYAEKALLANNEQDAQTFLRRKNELSNQHQVYKSAYDEAKKNSDQMRQMHDKLEKDIQSLRARKSEIKAKVQTAKAKERMNKISSSYGNISGNMSAFDRMEEKANKMLDEANAMQELNSRKDDVEDLVDKYDTTPAEVENMAIDAEIAEMKRKLGMIE